MSNIDATLEERGTRYGDFMGHAHVTQEIKRSMMAGRQWNHLMPDQREALEMVAHKIGRILNGDPNYLDSWHDIIGYVRLVEQRLQKQQDLNAEKKRADAQEYEARAKKVPGIGIDTAIAGGAAIEGRWRG